MEEDPPEGYYERATLTCRQDRLWKACTPRRLAAAINACEFMAEGKQPIVLEKGLRAVTITGCLFHGENPVADSSGGDVQADFNTSH